MSATKDHFDRKNDGEDWAAEIARIESAYAHSTPGDSDAEFARKLQLAEENEARLKRRAPASHVDRDAEYALKLQLAEQHHGFRGHRVAAAPLPRSSAKDAKDAKDFAEIFQAQERIQKLLTSKAMTEANIDAHTYTRTEIRTGIPVFVEIDNQFHFSVATSTPQKVQEEVLAFVATIPPAMNPPDYLANIKKTLELTIANTTGMENDETQTNVHHLLSRTWDLARRLGRDEMGQVAQILHLNIADQGSCMAGLVARLYPAYAIMLNHRLSQSIETITSRRSRSTF